MKVVIPENRLEQIIFKYLDTKLKDVEQLEGQYFDVLFRIPGHEFGIMGYNPSNEDTFYEFDFNRVYNVLNIHHTFIDNIFSFIPIEKKKIMELIYNYVENKYDVNFTGVKSPLLKSALWR
jgi:hypothetical protein